MNFKPLFSFIQNEWTIGIIGGVVSGIIVYWLTGYFVGKKENKVYRKNVDSANLEVLGILRPLIADNSSLSPKTLSSMISAVSRKWDIKVNEMLKLDQYGEELIREVMASNFISSDTKNQYTVSIEKVFFSKSNSDHENVEIANKSISKLFATGPIATVMGTITALMSLIMTITIADNLDTARDGIEISLKDLDKLSTIMILPILISVFSLLSVLALAEFKRLKRTHYIEKSDTSTLEDNDFSVTLRSYIKNILR
jgi:hypothetical protein